MNIERWDSSPVSTFSTPANTPLVFHPQNVSVTAFLSCWKSCWWSAHKGERERGWWGRKKRNWKCRSCVLLPYRIDLKPKRVSGVRGQCSNGVNTWREIYGEGERGRAVKEKVFMPWNTAPLPVRASSNKFRVNVGLGLTSAFSFTYRSFSSFRTLREPCAGVSCLLSPKLLDSKLAIMSEGFRDYILNQLNAIASVNFQNNRTAQRCHTDQGRLASAGGSVTPPL